VKATASATLAHNPCGEADWASGLRENLTSRSYGEGLETGRRLIQAPRQSFTRQRSFAWLNRCRRLDRFLERSQKSYRAFIRVFFLKHYLDRLF
jgi:hypothetical protein